MTLLLTCVTERFSVQASDRRLTNARGSIADEVSNKATLLCNFASFAYTGLAWCSATERTDDLLMRTLAEPGLRVTSLIENLRKEAGRTIGQVPLPLKPAARRVVRRTSFVGCGFVGLRNPVAYGLKPSHRDLHPFLAVVSNAQDLSERWRPEADKQFGAHLAIMDEREAFRLHVAGQPLLDQERVDLHRSIQKCIGRVEHPEPLARLLARCIRRVSQRNSAVGPSVMCTFVRREHADRWDGTLSGSLVPIVPELMNEAAYFRTSPGGRSKWVFSPGNPGELVHYGPNFACDGNQMKGILFGPDSVISEMTS